jgi:hypothetical protein
MKEQHLAMDSELLIDILKSSPSGVIDSLFLNNYSMKQSWQALLNGGVIAEMAFSGTPSGLLFWF